MPDWSYRTVLGPAYRRLPPRVQARALGLVGRFGASRAGARLIPFLGHSAPPAPLARDAFGVRLRSPLGTSARLPRNGELAGFASRLGLGFVEVGPLTSADGLPQGTLPAALGARLTPGAGAASLVPELAGRVAFVSLDAAAPDVEAVARAAARHGIPLLAVLDAAAGDARLPEGVAGVLVEGGTRAEIERTVRRLRDRARRTPILAAGGVAEPADALALLDAGADLVAVDEGLHRSGPNLPKRIHEALLHRRSPPSAPPRSPRAPWVGTFLLGVGMMVAGALAWLVAATRVVLPYDEAFVGMTRAQLAQVNARLLPFLTHDRITLAGTMVSIGILYATLAWHAQRRGAAWTRHALLLSAGTGFTSFFLFLVYGYFDPLHAIVSLILLPSFLWGLRRTEGLAYPPAPDLRDDAGWRRAQWGQAGFVLLGAGLVLAGLAIALIGSTRVFVPQDLDFMDTSAQALDAANGRLLALVAHDRAGFGGALVANGLGVLFAALWGVRRGATWLWWTFLAAGIVGFGSGIGVHLAVGYLDAWHLAPAWVALLLWAASLAALRAYLAPPARA